MTPIMIALVVMMLYFVTSELEKMNKTLSRVADALEKKNKE